jgi:3-dehydroquinate dehydratase
VNLAADGVVVLHVWMMIAHKLYSSVRQCKQGINAQEFIDSAVALWIGKEQQEAGTSGWMLYAVGQTAAMNFGHDGEASTNSQLMIQFNEMQRVAGQCTEDAKVHLDLRLQVSETIRLLSIPLLQQLLFHIVINDRWHVELYAMSVISQLVACHPQAYMELTETLYSGFTPEKVGGDFVDHLVTFMECRRISCEDVTTGTAARADLQDFIAQICQRLNHRGNTASIRGYVPSTDVREQSRIDLDVLQIDIFMRMEAREAALDYYMNGHNSLTSSNSPGGSRNVTVSLHSLATSLERARSLNFELFSDYYGTDAYTDDLIQKCFAKEYPLNGTSTVQLAALVTGSLQVMVSYRIILAKLQVSVEKCNQLDGVGAQAEWDAAVATFVGSIDMAYPGRNPHSSGKLMYSLGLEMCHYFSTCQETGEAFSNVALLKHFANGKGFVVDGECSLAESIIASNIAPLMHTLIIQGTLQRSIEKENLAAGSKESLASGFILAKAIQPLVNQVNATSARTLAMSSEFPSSNVSTQDGTENVVFDAFRYVLRNMSIDCDDIGEALGRPDLNVCLGVSHDDDHSTLGMELYVPTSLTLQQTNIAMDVAEMTKALSEGMPSVAKMIYSTGKNSKMFDDSGQFMKMRTLRGLSVNSTLEMLNDPLFNIFMFALQNEGGSKGAAQGDGRRLLVETREYADLIVQDALDSLEPNNSTLASEASVVLNLWMYTAHLLYDAVRKCRKEAIADGEGERAIDDAAAFWIGDGQSFQEVDGHLLYGLAEAMGRVFNTVDQGQSRSNRNILNLLKDAKGQITSCSANPASIAQLHVTINKIISMMMVPLVQGLIHNLNVNDRDRVKVFAYAFVPMTAGCSSETFTFLRNKLIDLTYETVEISEIVDRVYQLLPCLNLRCKDVGIHSTDSLGNIGNDTQGNHTGSPWSTSTCLDVPLLAPMAGYHPASNVVAVSHDGAPKYSHKCALPLTQ